MPVLAERDSGDSNDGRSAGPRRRPTQPQSPSSPFSPAMAPATATLRRQAANGIEYLTVWIATDEQQDGPVWRDWPDDADPRHGGGGVFAPAPVGTTSNRVSDPRHIPLFYDARSLSAIRSHVGR